MYKYTPKRYIYAAHGAFCQYFGGYSRLSGASAKTAAVLKKSTAVLKKTAAVLEKTAAVFSEYLCKTLRRDPIRQPSAIRQPINV